jgi:hypothetical protein
MLVHDVSMMSSIAFCLKQSFSKDCDSFLRDWSSAFCDFACWALVWRDLMLAAKRLPDLGVQLVTICARPGQGLEILVPAFHQLVVDDPVEPFLARLQAVGEGEIGVRGATELVEQFARMDFRFFDALGDLHFLFARQQRDLTHLFQVHADRIVQHVHALRLFGALLLLGGGLEFLHLGRLDDLDVHAAEQDDDPVEFVGIDHALRHRLVDVVVGEVALVAGQRDQFLDLLVAILAVDRDLNHAAVRRLGGLFASAGATAAFVGGFHLDDFRGAFLADAPFFPWGAAFLTGLGGFWGDHLFLGGSLGFGRLTGPDLDLGGFVFFLTDFAIYSPAKGHTNTIIARSVQNIYKGGFCQELRINLIVFLR